MACEHENRSLHPAGGGYEVCRECGAHGTRLRLRLIHGDGPERPDSGSTDEDAAAIN